MPPNCASHVSTTHFSKQIFHSCETKETWGACRLHLQYAQNQNSERDPSLMRKQEKERRKKKPEYPSDSVR